MHILSPASGAPQTFTWALLLDSALETSVPQDSWAPIFEKSYGELMKNLRKSPTYEKLRISM